MNNKFTLMAAAAAAFLAAVVAFVSWGIEARKNALLRDENAKTIEEMRTELETGRTEVRQMADKYLQEKNKLLVEINSLTADRDKIEEETAKLKKQISSEQDISKGTNEDLDKVNKELAHVRKERTEIASKLETGFKKQKQMFETKILTLDAQLAKAKKRLEDEAERYHYNLGVVYTRAKDYENAVEEFKRALAYNPNNARAHYNLGILYDDYFKDKKQARYHYRTFLELQPESDDAESVREWLADLER